MEAGKGSGSPPQAGFQEFVALKQLVTPAGKTAPQCATVLLPIRYHDEEDPCAADVRRFARHAAAAQPDVEALKLNPQNKLYRNEQADWCVGINKLDGIRGQRSFASSRTPARRLPHLGPAGYSELFPLHCLAAPDPPERERALVGVIGPAEPDYKQGNPVFGRQFLAQGPVFVHGRSGPEGLGPGAPDALYAQASIRSRFNEADQQRREANCMDRHRYDAVLKAVAGGQRRIRTCRSPPGHARTGGASRYADSSSCRRRRRRSRSRRPTNSAAIP